MLVPLWLLFLYSFLFISVWKTFKCVCVLNTKNKFSIFTFYLNPSLLRLIIKFSKVYHWNFAIACYVIKYDYFQFVLKIKILTISTCTKIDQFFKQSFVCLQRTSEFCILFIHFVLHSLTFPQIVIRNYFMAFNAHPMSNA